jgi:hypothetical protein
VRGLLKPTLVVLVVLLSAPAITRAAAGISSTAGGAPGGPLSRIDSTPFPASKVIVGAKWASGRYDPPSNQWGDILSTVWSDDGSTYVMMNDGGTDIPERGGLWRQSLAHVVGSPPELTFHHVGNPFAPPPVGIAYSRSHGRTWRFASKPFPAPLGNLTFIITGGQGGGPALDGYVYAIGTEREFNASTLVLGRVKPEVTTITDPASWQWFGGYAQSGSSSVPVWTPSLTGAVAVLRWNQHITYPQMTYDAPLHRYLLTFTHSYSPDPPGIWKNGAGLVMLESPTPWGGFSFVASSSDFGPSNGYGAVDQSRREVAVAEVGREL